MRQRPFKHEESSIARPVALLDSSFLLGLAHEAGAARAHRMALMNGRGVIFAASNSVMRQLHQCALDPEDEAIRGLAKSVLHSLSWWQVDWWKLDKCAGGTVEEISGKIHQTGGFSLLEEEIRLIVEAAILKVDFIMTDSGAFAALDLGKMNRTLSIHNLGPVKFEFL